MNNLTGGGIIYAILATTTSGLTKWLFSTVALVMLGLGLLATGVKKQP